jgi:cysteine desulfurase family protein
LDNAATTFPKPKSVLKAVKTALNDYGGNPGRSSHKFAIKTAKEIYDTRLLLAEFFGCPKIENVIFTPSCTYGINLVLRGLLKNNSHVVISNVEHNAVLRPIVGLTDSGIKFSKARISLKNDDETVNNFRKKICKNTKLLACLSASNVFGAKLPIKKLAKLAHDNNALFLLDAAQTAGLVDINVSKSKIDFLCFPAHKNLYGPMGLGVLIINTDIKLKPLTYGGTGVKSRYYKQPDVLPEKFESGTINVPGILGLKAGLKFVNKIGTEYIFEHEKDLMLKFYNAALENIAGKNIIKFYTNDSLIKKFPGVISFNFKNKNSELIASILDEFNIAVRAGLHCSPLAHKFLGTLDCGTVRVSPCIFTNKKQIDKLISCLIKLNFSQN